MLQVMHNRLILLAFALCGGLPVAAHAQAQPSPAATATGQVSLQTLMDEAVDETAPLDVGVAAAPPTSLEIDGDKGQCLAPGAWSIRRGHGGARCGRHDGLIRRRVHLSAAWLQSERFASDLLRHRVAFPSRCGARGSGFAAGGALGVAAAAWWLIGAKTSADRPEAMAPHCDIAVGSAYAACKGRF